MLSSLLTLLALSQCPSPVRSTTVREIQGSSFHSSLAGTRVHNVTGIVTAKGSAGFYITAPPTFWEKLDQRVSNGLQIFSSATVVLDQVFVGDRVSLSGTVTEFRASTRPNDLLLTELTSPGNITIISANNTVTPIVLGKDRSPPTIELTSLDSGKDGVFSTPNNRTRLETQNPSLLPFLYGLDFWESLEGQLVTVPQPNALNFENSFGEFWVRGDWRVTGGNARGGLTTTTSLFGIGKPDANPETIVIGSPLDGTKNPKVCVGTKLSDITGVVTYSFGFYYLLPLTAPTILSRPDANIPATNLTSDDTSVTIGDYNIENMSPKSAHLPTIASHIVNYLDSPDIIFLQEVQDNSGTTDDGTVIANVTLTMLCAAIQTASPTNVTYDWIEIAPEDGKDGGVPGGNIRVAYIYKPDKLALVSGSIPGGALDETKVIAGVKPALSYNPGRVEPASLAWLDSRKPLAALWQTATGKRLFTINVHLTSKSGSSSTAGDARPFVNLGIDQRSLQIQTVTSFVQAILAADKDANIVLAGDCNEFLQVTEAWKPLLNVMNDIDEVAKVPVVERYTYVFDQSSEMLDHIFISDSIAKLKPEVEHVHVNTWSPTISARISDHDPSVAKIRIA